jgi:glucose uptake protein GlcU
MGKNVSKKISMLKGLLYHPMSSLLSGTGGVTLLDAMPPTANTGEFVLKAVLAIIAALPGLIQLLKKKEKPAPKKADKK